MDELRTPAAATRREILASASFVAVAACSCAAAGSLAGCNTEKKKTTITTGTINIGPADQYPAGTANSSQMATYGIIITNDSGTPLAIRPKCTHMGCTVAWKPERFEFECPCHGSKFDLLGRVIHGPAKRQLAGIPALRQPDGTLTVNLDQLYALPA